MIRRHHRPRGALAGAVEAALRAHGVVEAGDLARRLGCPGDSVRSALRRCGAVRVFRGVVAVHRPLAQALQAAARDLGCRGSIARAAVRRGAAARVFYSVYTTPVEATALRAVLDAYTASQSKSTENNHTPVRRKS